MHGPSTALEPALHMGLLLDWSQMHPILDQHGAQSRLLSSRPMVMYVPECVLRIRRFIHTGEPCGFVIGGIPPHCGLAHAGPREVAIVLDSRSVRQIYIDLDGRDLLQASGYLASIKRWASRNGTSIPRIEKNDSLGHLAAWIVANENSTVNLGERLACGDCTRGATDVSVRQMDEWVSE